MTQHQADPRGEPERMALDQGLDALARRLEEWLSEARERSTRLKDALAEAMSPSRPEPAPVTEGSAEWEALAEAVRQMEAQGNQTAILGRMLESAAQLAPRVALFVCRGSAVTLSAGRGLPPGLPLRSVVLEEGHGSALDSVRAAGDFVMESPSARQGNESLVAALGGDRPGCLLAAPLWVRDRVAAILYADTPDDDSWHPEAIRVLASVAALSLEAMPARARHPRPQPAPRPVTGQHPAVTPLSPEATSPADTASGAQRMVAPPPPAREPQDAAPGDTADGAPRSDVPAPGAEAADAEEDARRFARLLASEIILYNATQIEEGRRQKDLYERLRDDVDRSYRMYEERTSGRTPAAAGIFREEMVRTLAAGDESALQLPWD